MVESSPRLLSLGPDMGPYAWTRVRGLTYAPDPETERRIGAECPDPHSQRSLEVWPKLIPKPLFVYFVQAENGGPVKIGQANNPLTRLATLQTGNPERLVIRALILASGETESKLHYHWRLERVRGEWFGRGCEAAIIAMGQEATRQQLRALRRGDRPEHIAEFMYLPR